MLRSKRVPYGAGMKVGLPCLLGTHTVTDKPVHMCCMYVDVHQASLHCYITLSLDVVLKSDFKELQLTITADTNLLVHIRLDLTQVGMSQCVLEARGDVTAAIRRWTCRGIKLAVCR